MPKNEYIRPPSRRWIVLVLLLLIVAGGAAWFLRPAANKTRSPKSPVAEEESPGPTAAVSAAPTSAPDDVHFKPPKVLKMRPVTYPEQALLNRAEGVVRVKFYVDEEGHVTKALVDKTSGNVMLDAMVLEYDLKKWTFQPATLYDKPVSGAVDEEFEFHLDPNEQRVLAEQRLAAPIGITDAPYPPEALTLQPQPKGACSIEVTWTKAGLVDTINLSKSSGSNTLDRAALRFAFTHWHTDPKDGMDKEFTRTMNFAPPLGPDDTPPPLAPPTETPAP